MRNEERHNISKSAMIEQIPLACSDELAAVELLEALRWGANPVCAHCGSDKVYKMTDGGAAIGEPVKGNESHDKQRLEGYNGTLNEADEGRIPCPEKGLVSGQNISKSAGRRQNSIGRWA